jgi:hypothetical protein
VEPTAGLDAVERRTGTRTLTPRSSRPYPVVIPTALSQLSRGGEDNSFYERRIEVHITSLCIYSEEYISIYVKFK